MILLDTCALVFDALSPDRLTAKVRQAIAATALHHQATLVTSDKGLLRADGLPTLW